MGGNNLSRLSRLLGLLACFILLPGAYSIEVGFYAENGGESMGIYDEYELENGISLNEESSANFDQLGIENTRIASGEGFTQMRQTYSGNTYTGWSLLGLFGLYMSNIDARNQAKLTPTTLDASQSFSSLSGGSYSYLGSVNNGNGADTDVISFDGTRNIVQTINSDETSANALVSGSLSGQFNLVETNAFWPITEKVDRLAGIHISGYGDGNKNANIDYFNGRASATSEKLESHQKVTEFETWGGFGTSNGWGYLSAENVDREWSFGHWGTWSWGSGWYGSSGNFEVIYLTPGSVNSYELLAMSYPPYCAITKTG